MLSEKFNVYTSLSAFNDKGMGIYHDPLIPGMSECDLRNIANYYSIILNYGESTGALYGPLPVVYRTELLLYVYTFQIENPEVKDERIKQNGGKVPAFLLIFYPTAAESYTTKARNNIAFDIANWINNFKSIKDIQRNEINTLNSQIEKCIFKEQSKFELSEIEETNVVIGKSFELLYNVVKYRDKPIKLLFSGTDQLLLSIARTAIFEKNSLLLTYYRFEDNKIDFKFRNIEGTIIVTEPSNPVTHKYLSHNLNGILHFANFSEQKSEEVHTNELAKMIKQTTDNCVITFAISQKDKPTKISETKIPEVLKEGVGRTLSLIDLGQTSMTLGTTIIEFLERMIEVIGKN
ncbi:MAG: hypothetical protein FK734_06075 [Asgard group archaeon]|nr:hypothetical protein [Asgard group archaeon]